MSPGNQNGMEEVQPYHFTTSSEIHLWLLPIGEVPPDYFPEFHQLLSPEEQKRNQRYVFEKDRICHLLTRVFIRKLLAAYLAVAPSELQFEENNHGRPALIWPDGKSKLNFNLSHAGKMIVCGVVQEGTIGIDVEPIDREVKIHLASSFFAKIELEELSKLPPEQQKEHFLRLWTLKEAYIKARGKGLAIALDSFAFYNFEEKGMCFWEQFSEESKGHWSFFSLKPLLGHKIAGAWNDLLPIKERNAIRVRKFLPLGQVYVSDLAVVIEHFNLI